MTLAEKAAKLIKTDPAFAIAVAKAVQRKGMLAPKPMGITKVQKETLELLRTFIVVNGYSPTLTEICELRHTKSRGACTRILSELEKRGYIARLPNHRRSITILDRD